MKAVLTIVLAILAVRVNAGGYLEAIVSDPSHPKMSASLQYTSKLDFDGGVTDVALVYHRADPHDSLWPQKWIDAGVPAISWTLLECGAGGNTKTAFGECGASVDLAQTLLSPLSSALKTAGGKYAAFGSLLVSPNGGGVKLGVGWKSNLIENGGFARFDDMRFPPRYKFGYTYLF